MKLFHPEYCLIFYTMIHGIEKLFFTISKIEIFIPLYALNFEGNTKDFLTSKMKQHSSFQKA